MDAKLQCSITYATEWGEREYWEDRHVAQMIENAQRRGWLLAVMDGHSGDFAAEYIKGELPDIFSAGLLSSKGEIPTTFQYSIKSLADDTRHYQSGSTLSMVYVPEDEWLAYVAILGDSPVIIRDRNGKINVSPEHNVRTNIAEREAAVRRGAVYTDRGYIYTPDGRHGLQMSRALGDHPLDQILSREPEIYSVGLGPQSFIVVASDGVLDPGHSGEYDIEGLAKKVMNGGDANQLVAPPRSDNATAVLSRFIDLSDPDSFRHQ